MENLENVLMELVCYAGNAKSMALQAVTCLKNFFISIGLPVTFEQLGIPDPDINLLVEKLHQNKGEYVGAYVRLSKKETLEIYKLAL